MLESTDMLLESLDEPDSLLRRFCWYRKKLIVWSCSTAAILDILTDLIALRDSLDSRPVIDKWVYATGEKEDNKTLARDKREGAITCVFCRDLHLTFMFSSRLQDCEDPLFTERWSLAESIFKQNYCQACQACHTMFAVVLPLSSCCANSLFKMKRDIPPGYSATSPLFS